MVAFCVMRILVFQAVCLRKKSSPQFSIFYFPATFSRRHLPPPVNGADAPGARCISRSSLQGGGVLSSSLKPISERVPNSKTKRRRHQNRCYRINQCANFQLNKFIVRRQPTHMSRKCLFIHGRRIALALKLDENDVTELNRTELN